jgi:hypothetical protein
MVESITVITLLLSALERIDLQAIFDRDPYESRGPVKIRGFCFTPVCDDGPERRGFRTG